MTEQWHALKQFLFEKNEQTGGRRVKLFLSPYDVPNAFRVGKNEEGHFCMEFRYIPLSEPQRNVTVQSDESEPTRILFNVGENTGRIYSMTIPEIPEGDTKFEVQLVLEQVESAIESLANQNNRYSRDKYEPAWQAASGYISKLMNNRVTFGHA